MTMYQFVGNAFYMLCGVAWDQLRVRALLSGHYERHIIISTTTNS